MMPTVGEICIRNIVSVTSNDTMEYAVKQMANADIRTVIVVDETNNNYYLLTTSDAIEFKIQNISMGTKLKDIILQRAQIIDANVCVLEIINQDEIKNEYMVIKKENNIIGFLSQTDIVNNIDPKILMQKQTIGNVILQYSAVTVYENEATVNTIKLMKYKNVDSVIIADTNNNPVGIFTTKDFLNIMQQDGDLSKPVKTYMSSPIQTVNYDILIFDAIEYIKEKHFKRLVVTDSTGSIKGVITQTELLRLVNNKWLDIIKQKGLELSKVNQDLLKKTASLEEKASKDFLTQLYNRRKFDALIEYEITQLKRYKDRELCISLLDIDGFKYINDTYGHNIGDMILQDIAKILKVSSRQSDIVCRWGGEEFAIALPQTNIEAALLVSEKIRITIESYEFTNGLRITCSFGLSQYHFNDTYPTLFKRADEALYKAKNTGKNKVIIESL